MLSRYSTWQKLGPDPLPRGRKTLERLQLHLDAVGVLDAELKRRYAGRSPLAQPLAITDRQAAASRRRLLADLAAGRRAVNSLIHLNDRLGEQQAVLNTTTPSPSSRPSTAPPPSSLSVAGRYARACPGSPPHRTCRPSSRAAADLSLRHAETHDCLDEITTMNTALESTRPCECLAVTLARHHQPGATRRPYRTGNVRTAGQVSKIRANVDRAGIYGCIASALNSTVRRHVLDGGSSPSRAGYLIRGGAAAPPDAGEADARPWEGAATGFTRAGAPTTGRGICLEWGGGQGGRWRNRSRPKASLPKATDSLRIVIGTRGV